MQQAHDLWSAIRSPKADNYAALRLTQLHEAAEALSQEVQAVEIMRQLTAVYRQEGADAVREMLKGQAPDETIEELIAHIATAAETSGPSAQSVLPEETVMEFADRSGAEMTTAKAELNAWRETLQNTRQSMGSMGERWHTEVVFADALLNILDGGSPKLPAENPYTETINRILSKIEKH